MGLRLPEPEPVHDDEHPPADLLELFETIEWEQAIEQRVVDLEGLDD